MAANMQGLKIDLAIAGVPNHKIDAHLVVGTPGKIVDWLKRKLLNPKYIKVFVLDEADNMVEEGGHRANSLLIKKLMPKNCQSLFFSATFPPDVVQFATKMVEKPDKILIEDGPEFLVRYTHHIHTQRSTKTKLPISSLTHIHAFVVYAIFSFEKKMNRCSMSLNNFGSIREITRGANWNSWPIYIRY
jgi:superfamily II DNA/RNA helicase